MSNTTIVRPPPSNGAKTHTWTVTFERAVDGSFTSAKFVDEAGNRLDLSNLKVGYKDTVVINSIGNSNSNDNFAAHWHSILSTATVRDQHAAGELPGDDAKDFGWQGLKSGEDLAKGANQNQHIRFDFAASGKAYLQLKYPAVPIALRCTQVGAVSILAIPTNEMIVRLTILVS
jgi:hypothetical protein